MGRIWDDILTKRDKQVIAKAGYAKRGAVGYESRGLGPNPVVLVIDIQKLIVGRDVPILEAINDYRAAMGEIAWGAIEHIVPFLAEARKANVPIIYTRVIPRGYAPQDTLVQIVDAIAPKEGDLVIDKNYVSAFFGTALLTHLIQLKVDTMIIVGGSTSGCVRATAVDARQHGFNVVLPEECIFDRIEVSHKVGLLDLWMKYAEVMPTSQVIDYLQNLPRR